MTGENVKTSGSPKPSAGVSDATAESKIDALLLSDEQKNANITALAALVTANLGNKPELTTILGEVPEATLITQNMVTHILQEMAEVFSWMLAAQQQDAISIVHYANAGKLMEKLAPVVPSMKDKGYALERAFMLPNIFPLVEKEDQKDARKYQPLFGSSKKIDFSKAEVRIVACVGYNECIKGKRLQEALSAYQQRVSKTVKVYLGEYAPPLHTNPQTRELEGNQYREVWQTENTCFLQKGEVVETFTDWQKNPSYLKAEQDLAVSIAKSQKIQVAVAAQITKEVSRKIKNVHKERQQQLLLAAADASVVERIPSPTETGSTPQSPPSPAISSSSDCKDEAVSPQSSPELGPRASFDAHHLVQSGAAFFDSVSRERMWDNPVAHNASEFYRLALERMKINSDVSPLPPPVATVSDVKESAKASTATVLNVMASHNRKSFSPSRKPASRGNPVPLTQPERTASQPPSAPQVQRAQVVPLSLFAQQKKAGTPPPPASRNLQQPKGQSEPKASGNRKNRRRK